MSIETKDYDTIQLVLNYNMINDVKLLEKIPSIRDNKIIEFVSSSDIDLRRCRKESMINILDSLQKISTKYSDKFLEVIKRKNKYFYQEIVSNQV